MQICYRKENHAKAATMQQLLQELRHLEVTNRNMKTFARTLLGQVGPNPCIDLFDPHIHDSCHKLMYSDHYHKAVVQLFYDPDVCLLQ